MRLLQRFLWQLAARGLHDRIAFVTDGRTSGTNKGCAIAHVAPEAAEGGPLAVAREGDTIVIDIPEGRLDLQVPAEELRRRIECWEPRAPSACRGFLSIYAGMAKSADRGAALEYGAE